MKKLFGFVLFLAVVFGGSFLASRWVEPKFVLVEDQKTSKFQPTLYPLKNQPFVIVVVGRNNGAFVQKTLQSVFSQNYENYRVIYIDDASDDGSFDVAKDAVYESGNLVQATLVQNEKTLGQLANLVRAVQTCAEDEIVIVVNGEDWLAHEWVLQRLNAYYADPDLWITYGQYCNFPHFQKGICQSFDGEMVRKKPFVASHLKTFYAGLFKKVKEADLVLAGQFLPACADLAIMIPMLEMAQEHFHFIPEVLYVHNDQATYFEDPEVKRKCEKYIRTLDMYPPLSALRVYACGE